MKDFFRKIKLVDNLTTEIEIQRNEFVARLKENVDEGSTSLFSDMFDVFSSSSNEYKGTIRMEYFKLRRRRRFFDMNMNVAVAKGTFTQKEKILIVDTEINGFSGMMIPFYMFAIIFYLIFISTFLFAENIEGASFAFPFLVIHAAFMFGLPYFVMRRSVDRMKHELEREFYYMTKNKTPYNNS
ncbi:hypothetical protein C8N40_11443 [Pontibacter mucosus]|uniref:Uncharacterized protein n=1 Tax=Pontibacter mucosus TaxID=1649266 RepID=A0A2T5Y7E1_9BACT|nr:hypothetical protein [Pontibacter mucosus]PTX12245.1 hypothetical protein C8N40_11443 [Pontibacter mucosus]